MPVSIDAKGIHYKTLNEQVKVHSQAGEDLIIKNVNGQRYIGAALQQNNEIEIRGVPGNDLAVFMDGPSLFVHGNIQDAGANTMNSGKIVVHGHAGDTLGYGMRGGEVYIRDDVGYRAGIHMKEYGEQVPVVVIGGVAGDFLGEYMAGGIIIVLNLKHASNPVGAYCASGMHGGKIFVRTQNLIDLKPSTRVGAPDGSDEQMLRRYITAFESHFGPSRVSDLGGFVKLSTANARPYRNLYVGI